MTYDKDKKNLEKLYDIQSETADIKDVDAKYNKEKELFVTAFGKEYVHGEAEYITKMREYYGIISSSNIVKFPNNN